MKSRSPRISVILALAAAAFAVSACFGAGQAGSQAPEFQGIANWINSDPLTIKGLRGKVVLVDFWTYTCVNCIRTMPYLKEWHDKYAKEGLVIVGVHSPEFEFEKLNKNVVTAAADFGLTYPIAQDNDFATWHAYRNQFWPAKYLVDAKGVIRYTHFGEGDYGTTERKIRQLLEEAGAGLSDVAVNNAPAPQFDLRAFSGDREQGITREIYGGYERNVGFGGRYVAHDEYYGAPDLVTIYNDPGKHKNQVIYLQGAWHNGAEALRHGRTTEEHEDYIALTFNATSVNAVIYTMAEVAFEVQVTIDGRPLRSEEAGPDVVVTEERSFFTVDAGRLYEVVALPAFGGHELRLSSNSEHFALFALTFGAYAEGP